MSDEMKVERHLRALDDMAKNRGVRMLPYGAADLAETIRSLQQQLAAAREALEKLSESLALIELQATNFALAPSVGEVTEKSARDCMLRLSNALRAEQDVIYTTLQRDRQQ